MESNNRKAETKIGFAVLYKFFQNNGRFPYDKFEISNGVFLPIPPKKGNRQITNLLIAEI
jgi:hypothetical protein